MDDIAIKIEDVSMCFNLSKEKVDNLKEYMVKLMKGQLHFDKFYALTNISLEVKKGESYGIIGSNGSGKSTLLKIISGIFKPTQGNVFVNGKIAPLIELGSGFDMDLTARENILLNGTVLGNTRKFMKEKHEEIIDFAELWDFVDVPLKNYSSGMVARLGFAVATLVVPEVFIVDEILSVGDFAFQQKCEVKMKEMISEGTTLLLVSHSAEQVKHNCKKAIWLNKGKLMMDGECSKVCDEYLNYHA
jgi:ABC-type polysaccharide/polyol phosphate transport system ATPase subunit